MELFEEAERNTDIDKRDYLIHKIFAQTDDGREILEVWKESLINFPSADYGDNELSIGLKEGRKSFIRDILTTIKRVENE